MTIKLTGVPFQDTNEESWEDVRRFVLEYPNTDHWKAYKTFVIALLGEAVASGIHHFIRAGMSMSHIILSTSDRRLEFVSPSPPRITLQCEAQPRFVAWSHANIFFSEPERRENLDEQNVLQAVRPYLVELWQETRPDDDIPRCLRP